MKIFLECIGKDLDIKIIYKDIKHTYIQLKTTHIEIRTSKKSQIENIKDIIYNRYYKWLCDRWSYLNRDVDNSKLLYRGVLYPTDYIIDKKFKNTKLCFIDNRFKIYSNKEIEYEKIVELIHQFYRLKIASILPVFKKIEMQMQLKANRVSFRRAKSRWGSCSFVNNISLNTRLLMLPDDLIEYIIVHELSHIVYKNHSKEFWALVGKYIPDYKTKRVKLREYENLYIW